MSRIARSRAAAVTGGVIVAIVAIAYIWGRALPRSHSATTSAQFDVPAPDLFAFATNIDQWPEWRSDVDQVAHLQGQGFRAKIGSEGDMLTYAFDVDFERLTMVSTITTDDIPFGGEWIIDVLSADNDSSRLTIIENGFVDPPIWRFVSRFIIGHTKTAQQFLDDLGDVCGGGECKATTVRN